MEDEVKDQRESDILEEKIKTIEKPQLDEKMEALEKPQMPKWVLILLLFVLSLLQIIYGSFLWKSVKRKGNLSKINMVITVLVFTLDQILIGVVSGLLVISVVTPLYNITSGL